MILMTRLHTFCLGITLTTFSMAAAQPQQIFFENPGDLIGDAELNIWVDRLVEHLKSLDEVTEMIDLMLEFKSEVESLCGVEINIDDALEEIQQELQLPMEEYENFKELMHGETTASQSPKNFTAPTSDDSDITLNINQHGGGSETQTQVVIPTQVALGVTIALCGSIIFFIPIPSSKAIGTKLVKTGLAMAVEGGAASLGSL